MARDFERRLARAETAAQALGGVDAQAERRRCSLRALVAVCDIVRQRLVAMRIDPELAVALRRGEEAAAESAGMPDTRELRVGYFGASTGAGAALVAAAQRPERIGAVVSRGGRPDLAGPHLAKTRVPAAGVAMPRPNAASTRRKPPRKRAS